MDARIESGHDERVGVHTNLNFKTTEQTNRIVNEKYYGKGANKTEVEMRSLTLAILAIATVSMTKSTTAQTYGPEYWCDLTASGRHAQCVVNPYFKAQSRYFDGGRRHFVGRGLHYNLGPGCAFYTMWNWPFTC